MQTEEPFISIVLPQFEINVWVTWTYIKVTAGIGLTVMEILKNRLWSRLSTRELLITALKRFGLHFLLNPELLGLKIVPYLLTKKFFPRIAKYFRPYKIFPKCLECNDTGLVSEYAVEKRHRSVFRPLWEVDVWNQTISKEESRKIINSLKSRLVSCSCRRDLQRAKEHIELKGNDEAMPSCPLCGAHMELTIGWRNRQLRKFWRCYNFRECGGIVYVDEIADEIAAKIGKRGVPPFTKKMGFSCPSCGATMHLRCSGDEWFWNCAGCEYAEGGSVLKTAKSLPEISEKAKSPISEKEIVVSGDGLAMLESLLPELECLSEWNESSLQAFFERICETRGVKWGAVVQPVRVAVTGTTSSPPIYDMLALLGRDRTLKRIRRALGLRVEGEQDLSLVGKVRRQHGDGLPYCPACGGTMTLRLAKRGQHEGNFFWGCSFFPKCRKIVDCGDVSLGKQYVANEQIMEDNRTSYRQGVRDNRY